MQRRSLVLSAALLVAVAALVAPPVLAGPDAEKGNVDELRFGNAVDASGEVPKASSADSFPTGSSIYASMRIKEAMRGTEVMLNLLDRETEEAVWSEKKTVPGGQAVMSFVIPAGSLPVGKYRAKVKIGDDWVAEYQFEVVG
jgi:hypothetical protein